MFLGGGGSLFSMEGLLMIIIIFLAVLSAYLSFCIVYISIILNRICLGLHE